MTPADLDLHARLGITPDLLIGVRRVTDPEARDLLSSRHPGDLAGLLYAYVDPTSGEEVMRRLRRDHPEVEAGQLKNKYLCGFGDRRHLYFPPNSGALLTDTSAPVVFIEAEKSALAVTAAAARAGRAVLEIACGGCWGWRGRVGKTEDASGARVDEVGPLPDLDRVVWTGREAIILFDANAIANSKVQAARGARVRC